MPEPVVTSRQNPRVRAARLLRERKHREAAGCVLLDTPHLVEEGLKAGLRWRDAFYDAARAGDPSLASLIRRLQEAGAQLVPTTAEVLAAVASTQTPQGIAAVAERPPAPASLDLLLAGRPGCVVALDGLQDPANVGAVLRSARAFGACGALLAPGTADPYHPRALRASAGAALHLPVWEGELDAALARCREAGYRVLGLDPREGAAPEAVAGADPVVLVVGSEGAGLSEAVRRQLDGRVRVPMRPGVESLNAAVAAAVVLYVLDRGRAPGT